MLFGALIGAIGGVFAKIIVVIASNAICLVNNGNCNCFPIEGAKGVAVNADPVSYLLPFPLGPIPITRAYLLIRLASKTSIEVEEPRPRKEQCGET